jgi:CHAT domain-containing protein
MAAAKTICSTRRDWAACTLVAALLCACSAAPAPQQILPASCRTLSGAAPLTWRLVAPANGLLQFALRPRGISVSAAFLNDPDRAAISPDERYGAVTLVTDTHQGAAYTVRVQSRDSRELAGDICVSAELVSSKDRARQTAERAFAQAGQATRSRHWQEAFDDYLRAARAFDQRNAQRAAEARQAMAQIAYRQLHRGRDSSVIAQQALTGLGALADPGVRGALTELQATIAIGSNDEAPAERRARALRLLDRAGELARQAPLGARELARLTILRGFLEFESGDIHAAGEFFAQAAGECEALRDWECFARAEQNNAELQEETGNNAAALQGYARALKRLDPSVGPQITADIWDNLGRLQGYAGEFTLGAQSLRNAIGLYAQLDNCDGARRALSTLGAILVRVGSVADALVYLRDSLSQNCAAIYSDTGSVTDTPAVLLRTTDEAGDRAGGALGSIRTACDQLPPPASLASESAQAVFRSLLAVGFGATLEGEAAVAARCVAAATPYAVTQREQVRLANAMGSVYIDSADARRARAAFTHAVEVADAASLAQSNQIRTDAYIGLARAALLASRADEARRFGTHALALGAARADIGQVIGALRVVAMSLDEGGHRADAIATLRTAVMLILQVPIDDLDWEMRATYLATQHGVFEDLIDLLIADARARAGDAASQSALWDAFAFAELGRARSLQYSLSEAAADDPTEPRKQRAAGYAALLARIKTIAPGADGADGWRAAVTELESVAASGVRISTPVTSAELLPQLDRLQAALIEYVTGRNDMYAFVIDRGAIQVVPLGDRKRINAAATELYERLHGPEGVQEDVQRAARSLAQLVLWPASGHVTQGRVFFIADDSLYTTPFAVLPWSGEAQSRLTVQQAETATVPSALFLVHSSKGRTPSSSTRHFELIGDPIFADAEWRHECAAPVRSEPETGEHERGIADWRESLPRLPGSRTEVLGIADLAHAAWPSSHINVHLGCTATAAALRDAAGAGADLLHIATHGYVDAWRPRLSALALTRASPTDAQSGVFGLLDILGTKANARLVVLSACDTSRGRLLPGEGVLGPAQAFLQSGALSVTASYWRIGDSATAAFMQTFYKYLLAQHLPVGTALRRTQLEQLSTMSAHNWAGFALFGWPDEAL